MVDISIKSKRSKLILGSILCVFAVIVMLILIKKNFGVVTKLRQETSADENELIVLNKIYNDANQRKTEVDKVLATLPGSYEEVSTYAKVVESVANATGVTTETEFANAESKETSGVKSIGVQIKATGSYDKLVAFIDGISELPYHIEIDSMEFVNTAGAVDLNISYRLFTNIN